MYNYSNAKTNGLINVHKKGTKNKYVLQQQKTTTETGFVCLQKMIKYGSKYVNISLLYSQYHY